MSDDRRTVAYDAEAGDGHERQAGTVWTATSHIVAVVAGSGVLALPWTVAQLGWVLGPLVLVGFSCVTYYTSALLADCYRYPDPVHGAVVNRQYVDAVRCYLVREPMGHSRRLHHHRQRQHDAMKRASFYGLGAATAFYLALGCAGYAAFGDDAPGNVLTGFAFHEPSWLVDAANACVVVHLVGAYQVFAQPIFARLESCAACRWPDAKLVNATYYVRVPPFLLRSASSPPTVAVAPLKLVLRTIVIMFTTLVAMLLPFFNAVLGLIGALGFWPLSVYFPVSMHMARLNIRRGELRWWALQAMSFVCLLVSIGASIGSVQDIVHNLKAAVPFKTVN
ncbi:Amino acid permease 6 [Zea mays]|uniref:Amino acid permease 6 n=2 Tax=Zea mays TaxID=4577 RepID=A0A1D6MYM4_MAIZE|nr:Amino acid permease 6 [Zea mays]